MVSEDFTLYGRIEPRIPSLIFQLGATDPAAYEQAKQQNVSAPTVDELTAFVS